MSTDRTDAPCVDAMALTPAPPATMFACIWMDTSAGYADTPCRAMPWSPAKTMTRQSSSARGGHSPWQADTHTPSSSSRPNAPVGFVSRR